MISANYAIMRIGVNHGSFEHLRANLHGAHGLPPCAPASRRSKVLTPVISDMADSDQILDSREFLSALRSQIECLERRVNSFKIYRRRNFNLERALLPLLSKAVCTSRTLCIMVGEGYIEEACALSRSLLDILFAARYIAIAPERDERESRAKLFVEFIAVQLDRHHRWLLDFGFTQAAPLSDEELEKIKSSYPKKLYAFGKKAEELAKEPDLRKGHEDDRWTSIELLYYTFYTWTSNYVHPTFMALGSHLATVGEPFRVFSKAQCPPPAKIPLMICHTSLALLVDYVAEALELAGLSDWIEEMNRVATLGLR